MKTVLSTRCRRIIAACTLLFAGLLAPAAALPAYAAVDTITVTTTADTASPCPSTAISLRCAIDSANLSPAGDTVLITFAIPSGCAASGICLISPAIALPAIQHAQVTITGYGQPGPGGTVAHPNTTPLSAGDSALLYVQLDGSAAPVGTNGLDVTGAGFTLKGLSITHFPASAVNHNPYPGPGAVKLESTATGAIIQGNWLGLTPSGALTYNDNAVLLAQAAGATVGGTTPEAANLISGNQFGIRLCGSNADVITGNLIGTDPSGTTAASGSSRYQSGVLADEYCPSGSGSSGVTVGGTDPGAGNVVSGNYMGISLRAGGAATLPSSFIIQGNLVGSNAAGTAAIGNSTGIILNGNDHHVGGQSAGARNVISGNGTGITLVAGARDTIDGNYIGTDRTGTFAVGNGPNTGTPGTGTGIYAAAGGGGSLSDVTIGPGNVVSGNAYNGVQLCGAPGSSIAGNVIGLNAGGALLGNANDGVEVDGNCYPGVTGELAVGGSTAAAGNVISGNGNDGVYVQRASRIFYGQTVLVQHNVIGTDAAGTKSMSNQGQGVEIYSADGVTTANNLLSGNGNNGYNVYGGSGNTMHDNLLGTDATGMKSIPNGGDGVLISFSQNEQLSSFVSSGNALYGVVFYDSQLSAVKSACIGVDVTCSAAIPNGNIGLLLNGTKTTTVDGNVISGNQSDGIRVNASAGTDSNGVLIAQIADGNALTNNYIGTNKAGTVAIANGGWGIDMFAYCNGSLCGSINNTTIGGTLSSGGNLVSGNGYQGIKLGRSNGSGGANPTIDGTKITGNTVGLAVDRAAPMGNKGDGIYVQGARNTRVGTTTPGAGNIIATNSGNGIYIDGGSQSTLQGNLIGTNAGGTPGLGNTQHGVLVENSSTGNLIGGTAAGAGNVIANNGRAGVAVGNSVTDHSQAAIDPNSIYGNGGLGIDLFPLDTVNCTGPVPTAPNDYTPCPIINASSTTTQISGTACTGCTVEVFLAAPDANDQNHGEGKTYLGTATLSSGCTTAVPCAWTLSASSCSAGVCTYPSGATLSSGQSVTATATTGGSVLETSEFAQNATLSSPTAAWVTGLQVTRHGHRLSFSWRLAAGRQVVGFRLFSGHHPLHRGIIVAHSRSLYRYTMHWIGAGPFSLHIVLGSGREIIVPA